MTLKTNRWRTAEQEQEGSFHKAKQMRSNQSRTNHKETLEYKIPVETESMTELKIRLLHKQKTKRILD